jgi:hypothetical protein
MQIYKTKTFIPQIKEPKISTIDMQYQFHAISPLLFKNDMGETQKCSTKKLDIQLTLEVSVHSLQK